MGADLARSGVIVRHRVMPNGLAGTAGIVDFIAREISTQTYINIKTRSITRAARLQRSGRLTAESPALSTGRRLMLSKRQASHAWTTVTDTG